MRSFFDDRRLWKHNPVPHILIALDHPEYYAYVEAHRELLESYPQLGVIPPPWLHMTVQGLFEPLTEAQLASLNEALDQELNDVAPIAVQLGPVWPGITAITTAVYPEEPLDRLYRRVRAACDAVPGLTLRPEAKRFWPHTTLAYARENFDSTDLNRHLRALRPPRVNIRLSEVILVNQTQDFDRGYYTWTTLHRYQLTP